MTKLITLLILLSVNVSAVDIYKYCQTEQKVSIKTKSTNYNNTSSTSQHKNISLSRLEYNNRTNFKYKRLLIASEVSLLNNNKNVHQSKSCTLLKEQNQYDYIIPKLYAEFLLYNSSVEISIAHGIIPFAGGNFKQYSNQDTVDGNGLFTVINISLLGTWVKLKMNNLSIIAGRGKWKNDNSYHDYSATKHLAGSGIFSSINYKITSINYNQNIQFDYNTGTMKRNNIKTLTNKIYGLGYSFEDYKNGIVLYTILTKNYESFYNHPYLSDKQLHGGSILLGTKKYFDIFLQEVNVGYEYFKTTKHFFSANSGSNFDNDYGFACGSGITAHKVYTDVIINKQLIFNINFLRKTYDSYIYKKETSIQTGIIYKF